MSLMNASEVLAALGWGGEHEWGITEVTSKLINFSPLKSMEITWKQSKIYQATQQTSLLQLTPYGITFWKMSRFFIWSFLESRS